MSMKNKFYPLVAIFFIISIFISCTAIKLNVKEEFPQLHPTNPIIIIPGIKGSQLVDPVTEKVIWGKIFDLEVVDPHKALIKPDKDGIELPIDKRPITANRDRIVPTSILTKYKLINHIAEIEAYQGLMEVFTQCGLSEGDIQQCTINDNLYLFAYDWRRDLVETAQLLSDRIESMMQCPAINNGSLPLLWKWAVSRSTSFSRASANATAWARDSIKAFVSDGRPLVGETWISTEPFALSVTV